MGRTYLLSFQTFTHKRNKIYKVGFKVQIIFYTGLMFFKLESASSSNETDVIV